MLSAITNDQKYYLKKLSNIISNDLKDIHYDDNNRIAEFATNITNGDDAEYINQFKERESDEQKEQRLKVYKSLTSYASSQIRAYYKRVLSVEPSNNLLVGENPNAELKIRDRLSNFYRDKDALSFLYDTLEQATFNDPNMLLLVNADFIKDENGTITSTEIYPTLFFSHEIIYREYKYGKLDFAVIKREREVLVDSKGVANRLQKHSKTKIVNVNDYYLFKKGYNVVIRGTVEDGDFENMIKIGDDKYFVDFDLTNLKTCPLLELGVYSNQKLGCENFISPLNFAEDLLIDLINTKSEHDLTKVLHCFLQRVQYANECVFKDAKGNSCNGGLINNKTCPSCQGSGVDSMHSSSADVLYMRMPEDGKMTDVKSLAGYITLPLDTPKFQAECIDKILEYISNSIFSYNIFQKTQVMETATGHNFESSKINSTLYPFACKLALIYSKVVNLIAEYNEVKVTHEYSYARDLKLRTKEEIVQNYTMMKNAGMLGHLLESEEVDLIEKQYQNNPIQAKDIISFQCHKPLRNKTNEQIVFALSSLPVNHPTRVKWTFWDDIVLRIRKTQSLPFHTLSFERQSELIDLEVKKFIDELPSDDFDIPFPEIQTNENDDV